MIEKFEKKIDDIKEKINKKVLYVATFVIFGFVFLFAMEMTNNFKRQKQERENEYNKSMYEAIGYIKNIKAELEKIRIINTRNLTVTTLASIWSKANLTKESISSLPIEQSAMSSTSKFLTQLSDYSYVLMRDCVNNTTLNDSDYKNLNELYSSISKLSNIMSEIYLNLNEGKIKWDELKKIGNAKLSNVELSNFSANIEGIEKNSQDYQGLIYDGAFSDHILSLSAKFIENEKECSSDEATKFIEAIFSKEGIDYINYRGEQGGKIDLYVFDLKLKDSDMIRNIYITKKGCKLYLMISDRKVEKENIVTSQAISMAKEFLKSIGIENLKETYYLKSENMLTINFAPLEDETVLYPDLIKVKVALDNGEICSVEAQGYVFNHKKREKAVLTTSIDDAKLKLNNDIRIISMGLAIIPTDSKDEVLTYEFKGIVEEREFLVYINTDTLEEEKVLIILETPGGTLTM